MSVKNLKTASDQIFDHYIRVGEIVSEKFSPYLEVIIHDLRDPEHSIIAIFNSHITGRKIGDGTSDIGYKKLANELPDKIVNYENKSPSGSKMKSSSLTIRDDHNKIIGSMAFNFDLTPFENIQDFFNTFTKTNIIDLGDFPKQEQFFMWDVRDELEQELNKYIIANRLQGKALTKKDKLNVVSIMIKRGHIKKRGSVSILSELLAITRPTLYKYIKDIN